MSTLDWLLGKPLRTEEDSEERIGVASGVPTFGLDALGSAAYGPEAALTILIPAAAAGVAYVWPLTLVILLLLFIVFFSYRQTIDTYPNGGGSYTVASANLGRRAGLLAAAALMIDYLLDVGVGISTGVGALVSAVPKLVPHTLGLCLLILLILTFANLRGLRESGAAFMAPTYIFVACLLGVLGWGAVKTLLSSGHPGAVIAPPHAASHTVSAVGAWLLIRAFASGCTALTGVEAVSNGVKTFKDPSTRNARWTLTILVVLLALFLAGIANLVHAYGIVATEPGKPGYQSLLSIVTAAVAGRGALYYTTIISILVVLSLSANTAFAGFPQLCRIVAEDGYLPRFFAIRGRRLVYTEGIVILALLAGGILIAFGGVTDRLIPLFAIGAFLAFTLSQAGMVMHWRREGGSHARLYMLMNSFGATATGITVLIVFIAKFREGAWITAVLIPILLFTMISVHRHYKRVERLMAVGPLDLSKQKAPVAVVSVPKWSRVSLEAVRYACSLYSEVHVLHVQGDSESDKDNDNWQEMLNDAAERAGVAPPRYVRLTSPYRFITEPVVQYALDVERQFPDRKVAVVVPELVSERWYQYILHNHRSTVLKARLLIEGNRRIVVVNVPWYLRDDAPAAA